MIGRWQSEPDQDATPRRYRRDDGWALAWRAWAWPCWVLTAPDGRAVRANLALGPDEPAAALDWADAAIATALQTNPNR